MSFSFKTAREAQNRAAAPDKMGGKKYHQVARPQCTERESLGRRIGGRQGGGASCCTTDFLVVTICWDDRG